MATRNIVILGAGSAGTMMANHLKHKLHDHDWKVTIIDEATTHYYQPGFLFLPFFKSVNTLGLTPIIFESLYCVNPCFFISCSIFFHMIKPPIYCV